MSFRHYLCLVGLAMILVSLIGIIVGHGPLAVIGLGMLGIGIGFVSVASLATPLGD